ADQEAALQFRSRTSQDRWIEVRYESLTRDPIAELKRVCSKFDLKYANKALDYYRRQDAVEASELSPLWVNLAQPVQKSYAGRFPRPEYREYVELVEEAAFDCMSKLGYTPVYARAQSAYPPSIIQGIHKTDTRLRAEAAAAADPGLEAIHRQRDEM